MQISSTATLPPSTQLSGATPIGAPDPIAPSDGSVIDLNPQPIATTPDPQGTSDVHEGVELTLPDQVTISPGASSTPPVAVDEVPPVGMDESTPTSSLAPSTSSSSSSSSSSGGLDTYTGSFGGSWSEPSFGGDGSSITF